MDRLDELLEGVAPQIDAGRLKRRVNAVLDADSSERKVFMRQKFHMAAVAVGLIAVLTGAALAAGAHLDVLQAFFRGDTAPAQAYVDNTVRSVSDENYTLTVDSSAADEGTAYLVLTVRALNEQSRAMLFSREFINMDTFHYRALEAAHGIGGAGMGEVKTARTEDSITWCVDLGLTAPVSTLELRLDYMAEEKTIRVPLAPAPSVTVEVGASGVGLLDFETAEAGTLTVERVTLTPFTCKVETAGEPVSRGFETNPRILFRMADGSIRTQSQMMKFTRGTTIDDPVYSGGIALAHAIHHYRFHEVQDLDSLKSILVFDREYPLDGSPSRPVAHDSALDPFTLPTMAPLSGEGGRPLPVRALVEALGGSFRRDAATGTVTCTYRAVAIVLTPGSDTAQVNGQSVVLPEAPALQNGTLAANYQLFFDAWDLDGFVRRTGQGADLVYGDWYIVP